MTLDELFKSLSFGPLANLSIVGEGTGVISESAYPRLLHATNQSLTALHSRFRLSQKTLILRAIDGRYIYPLKIQHAVSDLRLGFDKFIMDSAGAPFLEDILRIELVADSNGHQINLNDRTANCHTLFVPASDTIQLVIPVTGDEYIIEYRADHPKLELTDPSVTRTVNLPYTYEAAFLEHVAGKVYQSLNGAENSAKGAEHLAEFERLCQEHEGRNTDSSHQSSTNVRPYVNGWA